MEKYIIILVILAAIYYIQNKLQITEGFEGAPVQSVGGVDDTNAINTLAQIAKNLMTGGFTIPGSINLTNNKTKFTLVNDSDNCFRVKDDRGAQVLAINDAGAIYSKGDGLVLNGNDLSLKGGLGLGGGLGVGGGLNVGGTVNFNNAGPNFIQINAAGAVDAKTVQIWNNKDGALVMVGRKDDNSDYSWPGIVLNTKTSSLNVTSLILGGLQRKYMAGGYYFIRAYGGHLPLYNGWNFVWSDHNWTEGFRNNVKWNGSSAQNYFHNSFGNNMVQAGDGDQNWTPRFLAVMPGYKAKIYYYMGGWTMGQAQTFGPSEQDWSSGNSPGGGRRVHVIALALDGENLPPDSVNAY